MTISDKEFETLNRQLFMGYLELFRRRLGTHAMINGYYGSELPERVLRDVVEQITGEMKHDCRLSDEQHKMLKRRLIQTIFGATKKQWVKN